MTPTVRSVIKVGGSVLRDRRDYASIARRLVEEIDEGPTWIVVSAAAGVTDRLVRLADGAADAGRFATLVRFHERLGGAPLGAEVLEELGNARAELDAGSSRRLLAWGERASADLLRQRLERVGRTVPVRELTTGRRPGPEPNAIVPGFYLRAADGTLQLLPRGGGDLSAVLVAAGLGVSCVRLWKAGGGVRLDGRAIPRIGAEELLARLTDPCRPIQVEAVRLAARRGIELRLEEPRGRGPITTITVSRRSGEAIPEPVLPRALWGIGPGPLAASRVGRPSPGRFP